MASSGSEHHPLQTLSSRLAFQCPYYQVRQDEFLMPGGQHGQYYVIEIIGGTWIIPVTDQNEIVLIRNYRYPVRRWCWELPAGGIRAGQEPLDVARAELREEIGGVARELTFFTKFLTMNSISTETAHVFIARGVTLGPTHREPGEIMEVHALPMDDVFRMARANEIDDGRSALALLLAEATLRAR